MWSLGLSDVVLLGANEIPRIAATCAYRSPAAVDSVEAMKLMTYLGSDRALDVFRKWGFVTSKGDLEMYVSYAQVGGVPE